MSKQRLNLRLNGELSDRFDNFHESETSDNRSVNARRALDEGLRNLGYPPAPDTRSSKALALARGVGSVLGITALALFGIGTFLGPTFSLYAFGLGTTSIAFMAGAEIADRHGDTIYTWLRSKARDEAKQWTSSSGGGGGDSA